MHKLLQLAKYLRDPEKGCPWDRAQDFDKFKKYLIEEAQEAVKAIENKNFDNLEEELGDTLFNLIFLVNLGEERNLFTLDSVIDRIYNKMIERHPHVFGDKKAASEQEALRLFLEAKNASKK